MTYTPRLTKVTTIDILLPCPRTINITAISLTGFRMTIWKEKRLYEAATTFAISTLNIDHMPKQPDQDRTPEIPQKYHKFTILFLENEVNKLPPHQLGDNWIQL